jgi:hypothetical protein
MKLNLIMTLVICLSSISGVVVAQKIVQCKSGGTGTITECKQRDTQAEKTRTDRSISLSDLPQLGGKSEDNKQSFEGVPSRQCWLFPNGGSMEATANSTPPVLGARLGACDRSVGLPVIHSQSNNTQTTPSRAQQDIPTTVLGSGTNSDNCVYFARDRVPSLPYGLDTWQGKLNAINSHTPRAGSVAMIGLTSGVYRDIGHSAIVESVNGNSITIIEANYKAGQITRRTATGTDLDDAARKLGIEGYYQP